MGALQARDIVLAIGRGFSPERAQRLLKDDTYLQVLDIKFTTGHRDKAGSASDPGAGDRPSGPSARADRGALRVFRQRLRFDRRAHREGGPARPGHSRGRAPAPRQRAFDRLPSPRQPPPERGGRRGDQPARARTKWSRRVAKTVPLDAPTLGWARGQFARYYRQEEVPPPVRLARREFAAFPFAGGDVHAPARDAADPAGPLEPTSRARCRGTCTTPPPTTVGPPNRPWRARSGSARTSSSTWTPTTSAGPSRSGIRTSCAG